jgi:hypothetical protein
MSGCTSEDIELNGGTALEISTSRIFGRYLGALVAASALSLNSSSVSTDKLGAS